MVRYMLLDRYQQPRVIWEQLIWVSDHGKLIKYTFLWNIRSLKKIEVVIAMLLIMNWQSSFGYIGLYVVCILYWRFYTLQVGFWWVMALCLYALWGFQTGTAKYWIIPKEGGGKEEDYNHIMKTKQKCGVLHSIEAYWAATSPAQQENKNVEFSHLDCIRSSTYEYAYRTIHSGL